MSSSGPASPRASACRPSRSSTRRRCSASASPSISARRSGGRSRWRSRVESVAWTLVSGVRSSWPASAVKRRVAASARSRSAAERPRRASIALKLAASERSSVEPPGGTRRSRSSSSATLEATVRSRRSGRSTRSAASQHPDARGHQRDQPEREQAVLELGLAVLQRRERADDLQAREAAETGVAQRGDVGAVALAAGRRRSAARAAGAGARAAARRCRAGRARRASGAASCPSAESTASRRLSLSGSSSLTAASAVTRESSAVRSRRSSSAARSEEAT